MNLAGFLLYTEAKFKLPFALRNVSLTEVSSSSYKPGLHPLAFFFKKNLLINPTLQFFYGEAAGWWSELNSQSSSALDKNFPADRNWQQFAPGYILPTSFIIWLLWN